MKRKNAAAVALGRRGGVKGGPARAAVLTADQRSESARNAVMARWAKTKGTTTVTRRDVMNSGRKTTDQKAVATHPIDTSDKAFLNLLKRLKATVDPAEIRELSDQIERVVFHKQFRNA
jgi:hypothetical protein